VTTDLGTLLAALYVKIDDGIGGTRCIGRPPPLSDSELVCLAVARASLGHHSESRRLRSALGLVKRLIRELAVDSDLWFDNHWITDSTPLPCGMSRPTVQRSDLAGWASYGYCASHSRFFWDLHPGNGRRNLAQQRHRRADHPIADRLRPLITSDQLVQWCTGWKRTSSATRDWRPGYMRSLQMTVSP
jgi:hypothetical protein